MAGCRLVNDHSFDCDSLKGMTVEKLFAFHEGGNPDNINMIVLKLQEKDLWQRFFLDIGCGFWEEWDEESAVEDFEGEPCVDLTKKYSITGSSVRKITCTGSYEEFSQILFEIGNAELNLRFANEEDSESNTILIKL